MFLEFTVNQASQECGAELLQVSTTLVCRFFGLQCREAQQFLTDFYHGLPASCFSTADTSEPFCLHGVGVEWYHGRSCFDGRSDGESEPGNIAPPPKALPCVRFCVIFIKLCLHHMTLPGVERSTPWPTKAVSNHQEIEAKCQGQNLNHWLFFGEDWLSSLIPKCILNDTFASCHRMAWSPSLASSIRGMCLWRKFLLLTCEWSHSQIVGIRFLDACRSVFIYCFVGLWFKLVAQVCRGKPGKKANGALKFHGSKTMKSWSTISSTLKGFASLTEIEYCAFSHCYWGCFSATTSVAKGAVSRRGICVRGLVCLEKFRKNVGSSSLSEWFLSRRIWRTKSRIVSNTSRRSKNVVWSVAFTLAYQLQNGSKAIPFDS